MRPRRHRRGAGALVAIALCAAGCAAELTSESTLPAGPMEPAAVDAAPDPAGLATLLPPPPGGGALSAELSTAVSTVSQLLAQDVASTAPVPGDFPAPLAREKIEAQFDSHQRFEDDYRFRATELVAVLMAGLSNGASDDLLRHALSAIVLEDQAALGFGVPGTRPGGDDVPPQHLAEQLVRPRVHYAALSAQAYGRCEASASALGWQPWRSLCAAGARRMKLRAAALPACSDASLIVSSDGQSQQSSPPRARGLLLNAAYDVPLLDAELKKVLGSVRETLGDLLRAPLESPALAKVAAAPAGGCVRPRRPSEQLFARSADVEWLGLSLHCQGELCGLSACSHGEAGCFTAPLEGSAFELSSWLEAAARLSRSEGGPLIEAPQTDAARTSVGLDASSFHGRWPRLADAQRALSAHLPQLIACQRAERYADEWLLDVDRSGRVRGVRASSPAHPYLMDEAALSAGSARPCVGAALRELRMPKLRGGRSLRRLSLSLHIPASLQIELPLTLRHSRQVGPHDTRERLSRDGFAVGIARCMAGAQLAPRALGVCARVTPDGRVDGLDIDLSPLRSPRVRAVLAVPPETGETGTAPAAPDGVQRCLAAVFEGLDWSCRDDGTVGHVAATLQLPRELLERF